MASNGSNVGLVRAGIFTAPRLEYAAVPEPATMLGLAVWLSALVARRRKKA